MKIRTMLRMFLITLTLTALCSISAAAEEFSNVTNGSFENAWAVKGTATTGWSNAMDGGRSIVEDTTAPDGAKVLQMAADPELEIINLSYNVWLEAGTKYQLHYWVKSTGTAAQTSGVTVKRLATEYENGTYKRTEATVGSYDVVGTDGVWKKQTITVNPFLDAQGSYTFIFRNYLPESGVTVYYDKIELVKSEIDNGSFEEAYVTTNTASNGWRTKLDAWRVIDTQGYDGDNSLKLISNNAANGGWVAHEYDRSLEPNVKYTLSFYVKVSGKALVTGVRYSDYGLPTKYLFNDFVIEDTNGKWVRKDITFTVPTDSSGLCKNNFHFRVSNAVDNVAWYDDIRLYKSHIDNGSFEMPYANSGNASNGWRTNMAEGKVELDNTTAADGTTSVKINGTSNYLEYNYYLETGQKYRLTYWVKSTSVRGATSYVTLQYNNGAWTKIKDYFVTGTNGAWKKETIEFIAPASATDAKQRYLFDFRIRYAEETVWYDNVILEKINDDVLLSYEDVFASVEDGATSYTLPSTTPRGYNVVWSSNSPALVVDGYTATPVRNVENDYEVVLTATITVDGTLEYTRTRDFVCVVHANKLYAKFDLKNASDKKLLAAIASYEGRRLKGVDMTAVEIGGTTAEVSLSPDGDELKTFIWTDDEIEPISNDLYTVKLSHVSEAGAKATLYQLVPRKSDGTYNVDDLMMGYVIKTAEGKIIVIDGGLEKPGHIATTESEGYLFAQLQEITGQENPVIDAWIFTHAHSDHMLEFARMVENHNGEFTVNNFYYNFKAMRDAGMTPGDDAAYDRFKAAFNTYMGSETAYDEFDATERGDSFTLDGVQVNFIYHPTPESKIDGTNNASLIFTVTVDGQKILFLGDLGENGGIKMLSTCTAEELKSDIVQMAHHGQNGVLRDVYEAVDAKVALWPTPVWVWTAPYGTYKTEEVRWWMNDLGIRKNHVAAEEGMVAIPLPYDYDWRL